MAKSYIEHSQTQYGPPDGCAIDKDGLKVGCLQRIADATEVMARNYQALIDERDSYLRWWTEERTARRKAERRIRSLRGVISRMKNRMAASAER